MTSGRLLSYEEVKPMLFLILVGVLIASLVIQIFVPEGFFVTLIVLAIGFVWLYPLWFWLLGWSK